jgi:hypothetical protein
MDMIIRKVNGYGYLGIITENGKELYRTGDFYETPEGAFEKCMKMRVQVSEEN